MDTLIDTLSVITPGEYIRGSCGYCKNNHGDFSYRVDGVDVTVEFYQKLLDRGWRRSGKLLYKPDQRASCCPAYTIRVDSLEYHPSKDQRQALNRFNKQIIGQKYLAAAAKIFPRNREQSQKRKQEFDLVERIHESESSEQKFPLVHDQAFVVTLEVGNFTEEKYRLFENYQRVVHQQSPNQITRESFIGFLCASPIKEAHKDVNGTLLLTGSYHQCYWIDGKLVAMGVLDLLPQCVSGVYFMCHESVRELNFGKISAMREIALAKEKGYRWWYPGFYIHENVKMKYKRKFAPQQILSPESYQWHLFTKEIRLQLNYSKYIRLTGEENSDQSSLLDESLSQSSRNHQECNSDCHSHFNENLLAPLYMRNVPGTLNTKQLQTEVDLDSILIRLHNDIFQVRELLTWNETTLDDYHSIKSVIAEAVSAVGPELCKNMILEF
ncbi:Arginyl-tRNA--protein transferase 1 [Erysiphe necator]|nr:Arginyl-tRNA--protein transferase 1 [Erysiphe necator]